MFEKEQDDKDSCWNLRLYTCTYHQCFGTVGDLIFNSSLVVVKWIAVKWISALAKFICSLAGKLPLSLSLPFYGLGSFIIASSTSKNVFVTFFKQNNEQ